MCSQLVGGEHYRVGLSFTVMVESASRETERARLDLLLRGFQVSRLLRLVADLSIADGVQDGGDRTVADLAADCEVDTTQLTRVIRALASVGVFCLTEQGVVSHTPMSRLLRTDVEASLHHGARFWTEPGSWRAWEELDVALRNGVPHEQAWGVDRFDYLRRHQDTARIFDQFMSHCPDGRHQAVADSYDFSGIDTIVDVGGGNGEALRRILGRFDAPRGVLYDRHDVVSAVDDGDLVEGRIRVEGGDFFQRVPSGADLYLLVCVLHDWSDKDCERILKSCRVAMKPGGRLLVCERVMEPDPSRGDPFDYLLDVQMMAMYGTARERTESEFRDLLERWGFALTHLHETSSPVSILEASVI